MDTSIIYLSFDELTRMVDYCKNENGEVSKEFYDWYLGDTKYFLNKGTLIVNKIYDQEIILLFDLSNPEESEFKLYKGELDENKMITSFTFNRSENMTLKNIIVNLNYFSTYHYKQGNSAWLSEKTKADMLHTEKEIKKIEHKLTNNHKHIKKNHIVGSQIKQMIKFEKAKYNNLLKEANYIVCRQMLYFVYSMFYYIHNQEKEIINYKNKITDNSNSDESDIVKSIYMYSGYIDLTNVKIYKPTIKRNPDEPIREYKRHIQSWRVRGHYRNIKGNKIWINDHTKGEGELEQRIYSTIPENELNIKHKTFEVEKIINKRQEPNSSLIIKNSNEIQILTKISLIKVIAKKINNLYNYLTRIK